MENDPDINFYSDIQRLYADNSPYLYEDHLNTGLSKLANQPNFGLFHINIRSLAAHNGELAALLKMLNYQFPVVGMTETWLTDITSSLYNIEGYVGEFNNRCTGEKVEKVGEWEYLLNLIYHIVGEKNFVYQMHLLKPFVLSLTKIAWEQIKV